MSEELEAGIARALPSALKMGVYSAKKQNFEVLKYAIEGVDSLCNSAAFLRDFEDQEHLAMLDETAREFAVLETQITRYKKQLEKMEALIESGKMVRPASAAVKYLSRVHLPVRSDFVVHASRTRPRSTR